MPVHHSLGLNACAAHVLAAGEADLTPDSIRDGLAADHTFHLAAGVLGLGHLGGFEVVLHAGSWYQETSFVCESIAPIQTEVRMRMRVRKVWTSFEGAFKTLKRSLEMILFLR